MFAHPRRAPFVRGAHTKAASILPKGFADN
ncbi:hypothetical protein MPC1_460004 [Methylocella tundrae]|nr:hypothetical protein MPC1_460004 [Methylocella tundrae]